MTNLLPELKKIFAYKKTLIFSTVILFILILFIMPPAIWHPNEEVYLGNAWRRSSSENVAAISALTDKVSHRFLFDYLTGFSINLIGFEWTHTLGRTLVALFYAISLALFFRAIQFSIPASCLVLLTFVWLGEDILGGEWLFQGFEAKTLAYPLVFLSFSYFIQKKYRFTFFLLALATYFHFLVGAFWCLVALLSQLYRTKNFRKTLFSFFQYFLICLPLFIIIGAEQLQSQGVVNSVPTANWIYSYFRAPHHMAPFASLEIFRLWYNHGIIFLLGLTVASLVLFRFSKNIEEKSFSKLILALNVYLLISLIFSFLDKDGALGKFYLFRPSSLTLFISLCVYGFFLKNRLSDGAKEITFVMLVLVSSLILPTLQGHNIIYGEVETIVRGNASSSSIVEVVGNLFFNNQDNYSNQFSQIVQSSKKEDIFLIDPKIESFYLFFERKFNRPVLVMLKFVPTKAESLVRWYRLIIAREQLFTNGCPADIVSTHQVRYLLAEASNHKIDSCGQEVYQGEGIRLIQVKQ